MGGGLSAAAIVIQGLQGGLLLQSFGAYFLELQDEFGWSSAALAWSFSILQLQNGLLGPVQGLLVDRFGPRFVLTAGIIVLALGFLLPQPDPITPDVLPGLFGPVGWVWPEWVSDAHRRRGKLVSAPSFTGAGALHDGTGTRRHAGAPGGHFPELLWMATHGHRFSHHHPRRGAAADADHSRQARTLRHATRRRSRPEGSHQHLAGDADCTGLHRR